MSTNANIDPRQASRARVRADLRIVASQIPRGSRVLDLGCGEGELLSWLFERRACTGLGVERQDDAFLAGVTAGVPMMDLDIDTDLGIFAPDSFDVVVLSRTLQAILRPDQALTQMRAIAPWIIVTMPNFAYWQNRLTLMSGRMPQSRDLPFSWYETPNLHFTTLHSLEDLFDEVGLEISQAIPLAASRRPLRLPGLIPNWRASSAIYVLHRIDA